MERLNSTEFKVLLGVIRNDVVARPEAYKEGEALLRREYSPEAVHARQLAHWETYKTHPTGLAARQVIVDTLTPQMPHERPEQDRIYAENVIHFASPPSLASCTPAIRMDYAIQELPHEEDTYDYPRAQAIVLLGVMLGIPDADRDHPIFGIFGPWDSDSDLDFNPVARWAGGNRLNARGDAFKRWIDVVQTAWTVLPKPVQPPVDPNHRTNGSRVAEPKAPRKPSGRPTKYDPKLDQAVCEMWESNRFGQYIQLAAAWNKEHNSTLTPKYVQQAVKRHKERLGRRRPR